MPQSPALPRRVLTAALLAALPAPALARDAAARAETFRRPGRLAFAAEFDDPALPVRRAEGGPFDPYHAYFNAVPDRYWSDELTVATDPSFAPAPFEPFRIQDGYLRIETRPVPPAYAATSPKPYVTGKLDSSNGPHWARTGGGFEQKFGYWEIRCRMSGTQSMWSSFYLNGGIRGDENPVSGEINVFECLGHRTSSVYQTAHDYWVTPKRMDHLEWRAPFDWTAGFHTHGVLWTPERIAWFVDGVQTFQATTSLVAKYRDHSGPMFMIAGLGVGASGSWPGPPDATTVFPAYFDIDWIRVYTL